ncbi:hypothetical protein FNO01nite_21110 [Flavobacterium noncentrifugens]|uniref:Por secretion system C-terminal sorting domain-containing protein n=1 Tax=Flavobacterium noncentrifugens TaxID=1128970 RepID=A0A1G9AHT3_9FLAO|nr:zinc-dependent metalloprotease family protein [Flavobacterium noncentrifugens]GEP51439.1 hypothetical protein FNO01nite_21110 [Flavobacterium noncentrifugens]SDK26384.1 Por secretion system C-terminal sorting domain-containing protein [Flavobacterium noncentrifugens]
MKKLILFVAAVLLFSGNGYGQQLWSKVSRPEAITSEILPRDTHPAAYQIYALNMELLKSKLAAAPSRLLQTNSNVIIAFPNAEGKMQNYKMYEASVMAPELAARHPEIQSYVGTGIDDPTASIRITTTLFGLHTMTLSAHGTNYIDPYSKDLKNYIVYDREGLTSTKKHTCGVKEPGIDLNGEVTEGPLFRANNSLFKTYRLAMACTIEYAAYHVNAAGLSGGTLAQKKAAVLAAMTVTMARVNGVYERDMALTMVLIPNNEDIIFITSDEFDNQNSAPEYPLLAQSQTVIDNVIGTANYDIGHTVSTGAGGVATPQGPCNATKARGITGTDSPVGDPYDIDYVAHEMGHQWGCSHTFNSDQDSCGGGNRVTSSAFEPGSGTTIMAYAGICAPDNVQLHSDAYFHARSLIQMQSFVNGGGNCGVILANGNTPPVVSAGSNYTIPFGTAFVLTGSATDVNDDALTYCWEQYNFQISEQPPLATNTVGPSFRSYSPTTSPSRYFPKLSDILANNLTPTWEAVPSVARTMIFSLVVRDNRMPLGGQTERSTMTLTYANTGPFKVTSQAASVTWAKNSDQVVTWDVAGTDANGINTSAVNIKLSIDGGLTFPYTLAENTANDGNETIIVPDTPASQNCRIKVEAVGNVYFAINTAKVLIGYEIVNSCTTYAYAGAAFALPDSTTYTQKTINVPTTGVITDVNATVNATHANIQNLNIVLQKPGGGNVVLFNQQCSGSSNMNVTFDSQASAIVCSSPLEGTFAPTVATALNAFNGSSPTGNWTFAFRDMVAGTTGTINSFSVTVCTQEIRLLAAENFEFKDFALYPNPNAGNFTVQFKSASNQKINILVHDLSGRKIFDKSYSNTGMFSQNLQLDKAASGVYLVSVTDGDKKIVKRISVK